MEKSNIGTHIAIIGKTESGKTALCARLLGNIENILNINNKEKKYIIILSPHKFIEDTFLHFLRGSWKLIHFTIKEFDSEIISQILQYLEENDILGNQIFLFLDDIAKDIPADRLLRKEFINIYTTFRHLNISVISTIQIDSDHFKPILDNCGIILLPLSFGTKNILERILRRYLSQKGIPYLLRRIGHIFNPNDKGAFIMINLTHPALKGTNMMLTNSFNNENGYFKKELEEIIGETE